MSFLDTWKSWGKGKKIGSIIGVCCVLIIIFALVGGFGSSDVNTSSDSNDPFNGHDARLENVTISSSYGYFDVDGKIMFKNDESYADVSAEVTLKDGSKISESIVKNWNDVKKDQWYQLDGNLFSTSGNDYTLSDIQSADFIFNGDVIYTWKNK